jgi:hypothetical protein
MTNTQHTENDDAPRRQQIAERVRTDGNPDELDGDVRASLFTAAKRQEKPWRDPDRLESALEATDTLAAAGDRFGTRAETVSKWARVFGIRPKQADKRSLRPDYIRDHVDAEDVGLDPVPEPEGSA